MNTVELKGSGRPKNSSLIVDHKCKRLKDERFDFEVMNADENATYGHLNVFTDSVYGYLDVKTGSDVVVDTQFTLSMHINFCPFCGQNLFE